MGLFSSVKFKCCKNLIPLGSCLQPAADISTAVINNFPVRLPPAGGNYKVTDLRNIVSACVTTGREGTKCTAVLLKAIVRENWLEFKLGVRNTIFLWRS